MTAGQPPDQTPSLPVPADPVEGHLYVNWPDYHQSIENLARLVHRSGQTFDHVLCLARGGLRPGDTLSRLLGLPLAILTTSSYREEGGMQQGHLDIAATMTMQRPLAGRVLLVDDLVDSGITLEQVCRHIRASCPPVTDIRTAVIWWKACSAFAPDFHVSYLPDNPWIHQPFEQYDSDQERWLNQQA